MSPSNDNSVDLDIEQVKEALLASKVILHDDKFGNEYAMMTYHANNGRRFTLKVNELNNGKGFDGWDGQKLDLLHSLRELRPCIKREALFQKQPNDTLLIIKAHDIESAITSPNMMKQNLEDIGADLDALDWEPIDPPKEFGAFAYAELENACEKIVEAIQNNEFYKPFSEKTRVYPKGHSQSKESKSEKMNAIDKQYAENEKRHKESLKNEKGLFRGLYSEEGPLTKETKKAILSYMNTQSFETWNAVKDLQIKNNMTTNDVWKLYKEKTERENNERINYNIPDKTYFISMIEMIAPRVPAVIKEYDDIENEDEPPRLA